MEGREAFVVAAFCYGSLVRTAWSIPNVRHSNCGGVVLPTVDEAIEFACVEIRVVCWYGVVGGWGGVE